MPGEPGVALDLSFTTDLPLTQVAVEFARDRHRGQHRPGDHASFLAHPLDVAARLERSGYPDHVVAAAVLHDVLEDTDAERADLEQRFGADVAGLVAAVSDDPTIADEEERKDELRERVARAGDYALAVYASDKISKVRELRTMLAQGLPDEEATIKLRRYQTALSMLEDAIPGSRLVSILRFELESLERLPPE